MGDAKLPENLLWIKNCSLKVQGKLEARKPYDKPRREAGQSEEGKRVRVGSRTH